MPKVSYEVPAQIPATKERDGTIREGWVWERFRSGNVPESELPHHHHRTAWELEADY